MLVLLLPCDPSFTQVLALRSLHMPVGLSRSPPGPLSLRMAACWAVVCHCLRLSIGSRHISAMMLHASATKDSLLKQVAVCAPPAKA